MAADLEKLGHMNEIIRRTLREGVDPIEAIQMATINSASYFGLEDVGVLAPGKLADIAVISDLNEMKVEGVFIEGKLVALHGELLIDLPKYTYPSEVKNSVKRGPISEKDLEISTSGSTAKVRCIELIPDQNLSGCLEEEIRVLNKVVLPDVNKVGTNLRDMVLAVNRVIEIGGGLTIANRGKILSELRLPVGGLITDELSGHEVSEKIAELETIATRELGTSVHAPFMHLSFLALSTSSIWKITDKGLVDVNNFKILPPVVGK